MSVVPRSIQALVHSGVGAKVFTVLSRWVPSGHMQAVHFFLRWCKNTIVQATIRFQALISIDGFCLKRAARERVERGRDGLNLNTAIHTYSTLRAR